MSRSGSCASYSSEIRLNGQINQKLHWLNQKINYRDYTTMTVNKRLPMNGRLNGGTVNRCQPYMIHHYHSSSMIGFFCTLLASDVATSWFDSECRSVCRTVRRVSFQESFQKIKMEC